MSEMNRYIDRKETRIAQMERVLERREEVANKYTIIVELYKIEMEKVQELLDKMKARRVKKEKELGIYTPPKKESLLSKKNFKNESLNNLISTVEADKKQGED